MFPRSDALFGPVVELDLVPRAILHEVVFVHPDYACDEDPSLHKVS